MQLAKVACAVLQNEALRPFASHVEFTTVQLRWRARAVALICAAGFAGCANSAAPEPQPRKANAPLSGDANEGASPQSPQRTSPDSTPQQTAQAVLASGFDSHELDPRIGSAPYSPIAGFEDHEHRITVRPDLSKPSRDAFKRSLENRLSRSMAGLPRSVLANGSEAVNTNDRFQHVVVQVRDANGNLRTECLENRRQLDALLAPEANP